MTLTTGRSSEKKNEISIDCRRRQFGWTLYVLSSLGTFISNEPLPWYIVLCIKLPFYVNCDIKKPLSHAVWQRTALQSDLLLLRVIILSLIRAMTLENPVA